MNFEEEHINNYKAQMKHLENIKFYFNHMQRNSKIYSGNNSKVREEVNKKVNEIKDILKLGNLDHYLTKEKQIITHGERGDQYITYYKIIADDNWNKYEPPNVFYKSLFNEDFSESHITTQGWSGEGGAWFLAEVFFINELLQDVYYEYTNFCKNCAIYHPGCEGAKKCKKNFDMLQFNREATKIKKLN